MLYQERKWKEVSYREYSKLLKKFNRGKSEFERLLYDCPVKRELKQSVKEEIIPKGCGILEYIKLNTRCKNEEFSIESYNYYKDDGVEWIFKGGEEACKEFERIIQKECSKYICRVKIN